MTFKSFNLKKEESMVLAQFLLLTLSLAILYFGAEFALWCRELDDILVFPLLWIGLVIVGFETSLPEFLSQISCWSGHPEIILAIL